MDVMGWIFLFGVAIVLGVGFWIVRQDRRGKNADQAK